jgi:hypothetical protein
MSHPVTFGLIYDFRNPVPWQRPWVERYRAVLEQIAWIDRELSINGVYVTEHHFYEDGYTPTPMVLCAAIASGTERVAVGCLRAARPRSGSAAAQPHLLGDCRRGSGAGVRRGGTALRRSRAVTCSSATQTERSRPSTGGVAIGAGDINLLAFMPGEDVEEVSRRLQYLSNKVIPHVDQIEQPGRRLAPRDGVGRRTQAAEVPH